MSVTVGLCFDRSFPPHLLPEVAARLESRRVAELWVIEDCFYTSAISLAAAALATTQRLTVGIGVLPAAVRNPAIMAMEVATLAGLAPGRVVAGIGHGVPTWMDQIGAATPSPLATLSEVITAVRRLLRGDSVSVEGKHVRLRDVSLDQPPEIVPPVLAGVRGPKSLELAGRTADGLVLAEGSGPPYVQWARRQSHAAQPFRLSVYALLCIADHAPDAHRAIAPAVAELIMSSSPNVREHPHFEEMHARVVSAGPNGLLTMPSSWWRGIGAIGTFADAVAFVEDLKGAGADAVSFFPLADVAAINGQVDAVARIAAAFERR